MRATVMVIVGMVMLPALAGANPKPPPAALEVCFDLPDDVPLFRDTPRRNYRFDGEQWLLDFDLLVDGRRPQRLTRVSDDCLRAWLPARTVRRIEATFDRTDLNLQPASRDVRIRMSPDLWYEGGTLTIERAPWSTFATSLPGTVRLLRHEANGTRVWTKWGKVPAGRYSIEHLPPRPPPGRCPAHVVVTATGTVRQENKPKLLAQIVARWRFDVLPALVSKQGTCPADEAIEVTIHVHDGQILDRWKPQVRRVSHPLPTIRYRLEVDAAGQRFVPGEVFEIQPGRVLKVEEDVDVPYAQLRPTIDTEG